MRVEGYAGAAVRRAVTLGRGDGNDLVLMVRPLPLGFHRRLRAHGIAAPSPPTRVARDSAGKPLRDGNGLAVLMADERDASYLADVELYHQRVAVLVAFEALRDDARVQFETRVTEEVEDWGLAADAVYAEFEAAGWSAGDLIQLCRAVCQMSNLLDEHLQGAYGNFSPSREVRTQ